MNDDDFERQAIAARWLVDEPPTDLDPVVISVTWFLLGLAVGASIVGFLLGGL